MNYQQNYVSTLFSLFLFRLPWALCSKLCTNLNYLLFIVFNKKTSTIPSCNGNAALQFIDRGVLRKLWRHLMTSQISWPNFDYFHCLCLSCAFIWCMVCHNPYISTIDIDKSMKRRQRQKLREKNLKIQT